MHTVRSAGLVTALLSILSCDTAQVPMSTPLDEDLTLLEAEQRILTLIGTHSCQDVSSCASIPAGYKPCGGPWRYYVYSRDVTDEEALAAAVQVWSELERELSEQFGRYSDCQFVTEPALACAGGVCV